MEERRLRVDNSARGKLWEVFLAAAFMAHPYGRPIVGWESDISRITKTDAEDFFKDHYDVSRLVVAIVGNVKTKEIEAMLRQYFEPLVSTPSEIRDVIPVEPPQDGERRAVVYHPAEPSILIGYHRP